MVAKAEAKTEVAEVSRDALLADISDESTRVKAKLLADAAIAGVKVKKLAMALTAETGDVACAQAFSKMQLDASLAACDAAISTSRRRRLVADTAYDVTVFVSPARRRSPRHWRASPQKGSRQHLQKPIRQKSCVIFPG